MQTPHLHILDDLWQHVSSWMNSISWSVEGMFSSPRTGYWGIWQGATKSAVEGWLNNHVTCWATASWSLISLDHSNAEGAARKYPIIHCFSFKSHSVNPVFNFRFSFPERGVSTYILPQYPSWRNSISLLAAVSRSPPSSIFSDCLLLSSSTNIPVIKDEFLLACFSLHHWMATVGMVCEMLLTDRCHLKALCHPHCVRCHDYGVCQLEVTLCHLCHSLWPRGYCHAVVEWFLSSVEDMRFAMMES